MPRLLKTMTLLAVALMLPFFTLHAQQPAPTTPAEQPTAKDVVKSLEDKEKKEAKPSTDPIERIKEEGLKRSQVMATLSYLTDVIGPRLTGSPGLMRANTWTRDKLSEWGLQNAHLESWGTFGRGWSLKRFSAQVVAPQCIPLIAFPKAWSPGTEGPLTAEVVLLDARTEADLAKYKGKLKGAIVLNGGSRALAARFEPLATRLNDHDLLKLADAPEPTRRRPRTAPPADAPGDGNRSTPSVASANGSSPATGSREGEGGGNGNGNGNGNGSGTGRAQQAPTGSAPAFQPTAEQRRQLSFTRQKMRFLVEEGAALVIDPSPQGDGGTLFVASASLPVAASAPAAGPGVTRVAPWNKDAPRTIPQIVVASEHYNRLVRMINQGESLKIEVDLAVHIHDDDLTAYNTIAELPGTDLKDELVMLGGHMDSWHSGTGATDNAAGVSVAMEAIRILKVLDLKPRRTIRIALWTGEEQGLLGSRGYVSQHFKKIVPPRPASATASKKDESASSPASEPPSGSEADLAPKPEYEKFSAYFNLDNGTGKVRGVYLQGNEAVRPIFRKWLQPFNDMEATTLSLANTGGTDHQSFDGVGLPGFQFIQDSIDYESRTHHSNQDVYDRIQADDMKQAAVIMAAFVYNTAMRDEKLPRKPAER